MEPRTKPVKIGFDCRMYSSGFTGIGRYTHELVDEVIKLNKAQEHPFEIVLFFNNPEYSKFKCPENVRKVLVNAKHYSLAEQTRFLRILNKEKLDIMHFPHFNAPILYRRPFTVTIHDLILSLYPGKKMTNILHRLAYHLTIRHSVKKAKHIIAVSNHTSQDLQRHFGSDPNKITTIYNGISKDFEHKETPSATDKVLKKHQITQPFLLYTGVWRDHKNLPRLIHAFHILREERNLNLQLVITGKEDPFYPEVKTTVRQLKLDDHVVFPGLVPEEELVHLYNGAKIFVFPSLYEGFGLPPLEAMRCATPVAASTTSSVPEICGEAALYFNPLSPEDIADKIELLYKDTDLEIQLIEKGILHIEKFSWEKMAKETWGLMLSTLK